MTQIVRFAPSPNGFMHLGHAYSALLNQQAARLSGGQFLLRIEDIDQARCLPHFEQGIFDDLAWLGLTWQQPVRRQSDHFEDYAAALSRLRKDNLIYPAFLSRGAVNAMVEASRKEGKIWPKDPDGAPLYPIDERAMTMRDAQTRINGQEPFNWRLNMDEAIRRYGADLSWHETGSGPNGETGTITAQPELWGDVVIARSDIPTSYHLSVVIDDALQGVSTIIRGRDLFHATSVHRLLQQILDLLQPDYHHHDLILAPDGRKLSKSRGDTALKSLRKAGYTPSDIRHMIDL